MTTNQTASLLEVRDATKHFGRTQALDGASITVAPGELVGVAGHNGAGKSTLLRAIAGSLRLDDGDISLDGHAFGGSDSAQARNLGVRTVHQEQSLCPSLRVDETAAVAERRYGGMHWRARAGAAMLAALDRIFPDHGLKGRQRISELTVTQRQMVEIATLALGQEGSGDPPARLLLLDEPTSSLDAGAATKLYAWLHDTARAGTAAVVTTHRLQEMLDQLDRVYVIRDGKVVAERKTSDLQRDELVELMGAGALQPQASPAGPGVSASEADTSRAAPGEARVIVNRLHTSDLDDVSFEVRAGELLGLAGLEGHGQRPLLEAMFDETHRRGRRRVIRIDGSVAFVTGDRAVQGIMKYWTVGRNITISSLRQICRGGILSAAAERGLVTTWTEQLNVRGDERQPITALSGGNQQKALVARAIATGADVLLLDDPTRGVDQRTKEQIYATLREQARRGTAVIWYSTENEELLRCDRLCVLRRGRLVQTLAGDEVDEEHMIAASFGPTADEHRAERPAAKEAGRR